MKTRALCVLVMTALIMTAGSCRGGKKKEKAETKVEAEATSGETTQATSGETLPATERADVTYTIHAGSDILSLFDVKALYTNAEGVTTEAEVSEIPWEIVITEVPLPFRAKIEVKCEPKEEYPAKDRYEVGISSGLSYVAGSRKGSPGSSISHMNIGADKIRKYQEGLSGKKFPTEFTIE